jgi:hypothetical protein
VAVAHEQDGRNVGPGTRVILEELRDLRLEMRADRVRSDERFERVMRDFQQDSARREAVTQKAFKEIRVVGLSIVKTLNRHTKILEHSTRILEHNTQILERNTRILERMDRKLGARGNGRPGQDNGRNT